MTEADQRALVRDWNLAHGWGAGDEVDRGHAVQIHCAERAIERDFHRTGCDALLDYYGFPI